MLDYNGFSIFWEGHASVRIVDEDFTVAVDPYEPVSEDFSADLVLVTHRDEGHFDPGKLEQLCDQGTCVVVPDSFSEDDIPCMDVELIEEGEVMDVFGIEVEAIPMYNRYHERGKGNGFRFKMRETEFYVAGDAGFMDEMMDMEGRVDIAFLPVDGVFTMDVEKAVKSAVRIKPELVIPYHYGEPFFKDENPDLRGMKAELEDRNIECKILERS